MSRIFLVPDAETLARMEHLCKGGTTVKNFAKVWNAQKRAKGQTIWDGKIGVWFGPFGEGRMAKVYRTDAKGDRYTIALLKYNPALEWCRENLNQAE